MCWQGFLARGLRPRGERAVGSFGGHCPGSTETPEGRLSSEQLRHLGPGAVEAVKQRTRPLSTPDKLEGLLGVNSGQGLRYLLDTSNTGLLCRVSRTPPGPRPA